MRTRTILAPTLILALTACGAQDVRTVGEYDTIENRTDATVRVSDEASDGDPETVEIDCLNGDASSVVIAADDGSDEDEEPAEVTITANGSAEDCEIVVDADTLTRIDVGGNGDLIVDGTATALADVTIRGTGDLAIDALETESFALVATGTGNLGIDAIDVAFLDVELTGTSDATLVGEADSSDMLLDGSAVVYGRDLTIGELDIEMSGDTMAEVSVVDDLDADLSGSAQLDVWGSEGLDVTGVVTLANASFELH